MHLLMLSLGTILHSIWNECYQPLEANFYEGLGEAGELLGVEDEDDGGRDDLDVDGNANMRDIQILHFLHMPMPSTCP